MKIDGNDLMKQEIQASRAGNEDESWRLKQEFLKQVRDNGDHCSCPEACPHHGNCFECVTLHRGHQDHLPYCMWEMVNQKNGSDFSADGRVFLQQMQRRTVV